jgi:hypothetical protein
MAEPLEHDAEAEILFPDVEVMLQSGRKVTVREIRFGQAMRLGPKIRPLALALARGCTSSEITEADAYRIFGIGEDYPDEFYAVLCASTGLEREEIEALPELDGEAVQLAFWRVNTGFFARRVLRSVRLLVAERVNPAGPKSSPGSSNGDTIPSP